MLGGRLISISIDRNLGKRSPVFEVQAKKCRILRRTLQPPLTQGKQHGRIMVLIPTLLQGAGSETYQVALKRGVLNIRI